MSEDDHIEAERIERLEERRKDWAEDNVDIDERFGQGSFGCHEAMHVANMLAWLIEDQLCNQGAPSCMIRAGSSSPVRHAIAYLACIRKSTRSTCRADDPGPLAKTHGISRFRPGASKSRLRWLRAPATTDNDKPVAPAAGFFVYGAFPMAWRLLGRGSSAVSGASERAQAVPASRGRGDKAPRQHERFVKRADRPAAEHRPRCAHFSRACHSPRSRDAQSGQLVRHVVAQLQPELIPGRKRPCSGKWTSGSVTAEASGFPLLIVWLSRSGRGV